MSSRSIGLDDAVQRYLTDVSIREPETLRRLRGETATLERSAMQISPEQGQFMALLVTLLGARRIVEIGTFTGYSALRMALALPPDGRIVACDVSEEWTLMARRYWEEAGVADRIDLRLGPATETLRSLQEQGEVFDLAFIDADKQNYDRYYEQCLDLVRPGGVILIDNVLWSGRVADPEVQDTETAAIRELNAKLRDDDRVDISMVPIGDGLTITRRRD
jgi:caffeoyl-CoA O-methyltransferase